MTVRAFRPGEAQSKAQFWAVLARLNDGAGGRNRTDTPLGTAF